MKNWRIAVDFPRVFGDSGRTRTCNPLLRRQMLYPVELRSRRMENNRKTRGKARLLEEKPRESIGFW
tara:strand:- start:383 stop:583 length:201 start_codon:yes stop_codon:yes gene_type:complete